MSFSSEVKIELAGHIGKSRHCQLAELAALLAWQTEKEQPEEKTENLLHRLFGINLISEGEKLVYQAVKMWDESKDVPAVTGEVDGILLKQSCCKRAYIRGAFLAAGSISNPNKSYHFEIVCLNEKQAHQLQENINSFGLDAKIVERKKHYVVYLKEGAQIVDILNVMEAHVALMNLENVRILKEMRNTVNRKVNCETANISKTVNAAVKQVEDIIYLRDTIGLDSLPESLKEMAELRLEYPEAPLKELGTYLDPPVGKSGVNHRLRKISLIAEANRQ